MKIQKSNSFNLLVLSTLLFFAFPSSGFSFWWEASEETRDKVKAICEERGGLNKPPGRLYVDGYYLERTSPMFGVDQMMKILTHNRFQFLEMDSDWVKKHGSWWPFDRYKIKGTGKYIRFYIAKAGDENCAAYENYIKEERSKTICFLRAYGLYPDSCVAAVKTDSLKSEYGIYVDYENDLEMEDIRWHHSSIRENTTGKIYAGFKSFNYCWKGRKESGSCRGGSSQRYDCYKDRPGVDKMETSFVIYNDTLRSTPNPLLKKRLEFVDIRKPIKVPINHVTPELLETVTDRSKIEVLDGDAYFDLYKPTDPEGRVWFENRHVKWEENGEGHVARQPLLVIIDDSKRKILKVDINVGNKKGHRGYEFSNLRAIEGDAIYFIARKMLHGEHFWIMRYSWQGELLRVTVGKLPFPLQVTDEYQRWYAHLDIFDSEYRFSLLDARYHNKGKPFHPRKEIKFRIPFK